MLKKYSLRAITLLILVFTFASCKKETVIIREVVKEEEPEPEEKQITAYKDVVEKLLGRWKVDEIFFDYKDENDKVVFKSSTIGWGYLTFYDNGKVFMVSDRLNTGGYTTEDYGLKKPADKYILSIRNFKVMTGVGSTNASLQIESFTENRISFTDKYADVYYYDQNNVLKTAKTVAIHFTVNRVY
ncbi:hypothetical protein [Mucilaginibacter defluvii]